MKRTPRAASIAQVAALLWAQKGYHGAGIEELSQSVGLQRGALYHHIGSKEALLHEVARQAICRLLDATSPDPSQPASRELRKLSRGLMTDIAEHQAEWTVFFREIGWLTGERKAEVYALRERYEQHWLDVLSSGERQGEFRAMDPILVKGILGMHNYAYLWLRPDGRLSPNEIADAFVGILLSGLASSGDL